MDSTASRQRTALFKEKGWSFKFELEPDKPKAIIDMERLLTPRRVEQKLGRNPPCSCESGSKVQTQE